MMPVTMAQLAGANDGDLENLCRTAHCESFEMGRTGLKNKGHAGQHRVTKMESTAHIHAEIGVDVSGRVHIHALYPKA
jgi:hypothetical protein